MRHHTQRTSAVGRAGLAFIILFTASAVAEDQPIVPPTAVSSGKTFEIPSTIMRSPRPIELVLPPNYPARDSYPLVVRLCDERRTPDPIVASASSQGYPIIAVYGCDLFGGFSPPPQSTIQAVTWAIGNLNIDPRSVYLDASGNGANAALLLAALRPDLFSGVVLRTPSPCDQIPDNLKGLPVLLVYDSPRPGMVPITAAAVHLQLTRAGSVVDRFGIPSSTLAQTNVNNPQTAIDTWMSSHRGPFGRLGGNLLVNDPLYGLYDGRPLCIVIPTGGDGAYRTAVNRMARHFATGGNFYANGHESRLGLAVSPGDIPVLSDVEVLAGPVRAHWILLGSPETNSAVAAQLAYSPVRLGNRWIEFANTSRRYPADQFGLVYARTNVLDVDWRILVLAATQPRFFLTYSEGPVVPNTHLPLARRRPDLAILHAYTEAVAGFWSSDSFGRLRPSSDPRRIPAIVSTVEQVDRLKAEAARVATGSSVSFAATNPEAARRTVVDGDELDLGGLIELVGNEPIITFDIPADRLTAAFSEAEGNSAVTVRSPGLRVDASTQRSFRVAVPLQHLPEVSRQIPALECVMNLSLATQTIHDGVLKLFGRPGDLNRDEKIDSCDLILFKRCFSGYGGPVSIGCRLADLDGDGTVDTRDLDCIWRFWDGPALNRAFVESLMNTEDVEDAISNPSASGLSAN